MISHQTQNLATDYQILSKKNKSCFVVYIDESGDEGFIFREDGSGSSRWFIISAVIVRKENDLSLVSCLKEVRKILKKDPKTPLHFVDLKHEQRVPYIKKIADLKIKTISVLIHKPSIKDPRNFQTNKYLLYKYATSLLIERVSWLCHEFRNSVDKEKFAEIIFSNRSNMSYQDIREYIEKILNSSNSTIYNIINTNFISSIEHHKLAGLQIADAVASGVNFAVKLNQYKETEFSYLKHLNKTIYRSKDAEIYDYGLKFFPTKIEELNLEKREKQRIILDFKELYITK